MKVNIFVSMSKTDEKQGDKDYTMLKTNTRDLTQENVLQIMR